MELDYDPEIDAAYVRLRSSRRQTDEIAPGVLMDLAVDGRLVGVRDPRRQRRPRGTPAGCDVRAGQPGARREALTRD
ncbi:MAG TPA: DUF2283 domain-containing protein [Chloroflexota bacterium]|nr:DUF2283 domain-containing protein [Chloroflexota bacterium]